MPNPPPKLPGALPVLGHGLLLRRDPIAFVRDGYAQCGPVFQVQLGPKPAVVLVGPDLQELFFTKTDTIFRMDLAYAFLRACFGDIAFTASPETYYAERHVLHAPFKGKKMPGYVAVMQEETQRWIDGLGEAGTFETVAEMKRLTQNIAAHALMGRAFREGLSRDFWPQYDDIAAALDPLLPPHWPLPKFRRRDRARQRIHEMLRPLLAARRDAPGDYDYFLADFAVATYQDGRPLAEARIMNYIMGLIFAGHETTSGQASWMIVDLLQHAPWHTRTRDEVDAACVRGAAIGLDTLARLPLLQAAMRESERMHPVWWRTSRSTATPCPPVGWRWSRPPSPTACPSCFANRTPMTPADSAPNGTRPPSTATVSLPSAAVCTSARA
mgnify:CR=1 FL=1